MCNFFKNIWIYSAVKLPHPEEGKNKNATLANINVQATLIEWKKGWSVPESHWHYWENAIAIHVFESYPDFIMSMGISEDTPAVSWESSDGKRNIALKPAWLNPGVIAHEQAHNSYALLDDSGKLLFARTLHTLRETDPLLVKLFMTKAYASTSDIEAHAEIYRYIGQYMPDQLKPYYPRLF